MAGESLVAARRSWTKEEAVSAIRAFATKRGYQPVSNEAGAHNGIPSWVVAHRLFGGWNAMIEAAGFEPYPARNSALAKTRAFRDRNPDWRASQMKNVHVSKVAS